MNRLIALLLFGAFAPIAPATLHAQDAGRGLSLDAIEAMLDDGDYDVARGALERWSADSTSASTTRRSTAAMIHARLEMDGTAAQHAFLGVALGNPFAPEAGVALLRVGQAALLSGDTTGARTYLRRMVDDFPTSSRRPEALLWLSRTHAARGDAAQACETARAGLAAGAGAEAASLLRRQESSLCSTPANMAATVAPASASELGAAGPHAVQLGAFRGEAGARQLAARLGRAGFHARIVRVPANELLRVRVGRFNDAAAAVSLRDRLRAAGFEAVAVADAQRERAAP